MRRPCVHKGGKLGMGGKRERVRKGKIQRGAQRTTTFLSLFVDYQSGWSIRGKAAEKEFWKCLDKQKGRGGEHLGVLKREKKEWESASSSRCKGFKRELKFKTGTTYLQRDSNRKKRGKRVQEPSARPGREENLQADCEISSCDAALRSRAKGESPWKTERGRALN